MRLVRFKAGRRQQYGVIKGDTVSSYAGQPFSRFFKADGGEYALKEVRLLAPCQPGKIVCLGVNYHSHAEEFSHPVPVAPLIFLKPPTAVIGPDDNIILPHNGHIDYECELAVVIGRTARHVGEKTAMDYILGYTCFNDISDRDAQKQDQQWTRAKGYDTFAPMGPWVETGVCPSDLKIETYLNGSCRQSSRTRYLIFGIPQLVSFISGVMTLLPGDVIATGTPSGVGPLHAGDSVEVRIEGIGTLRNSVIKTRCFARHA